MPGCNLPGIESQGGLDGYNMLCEKHVSRIRFRKDSKERGENGNLKHNMR